MISDRKIEIWAPAVAVHAAAAPTHAAAAAAPARAAAALPLPSLQGFLAYQVDMSVLLNNLKQSLADFQQVVDGLPKSQSGYCIDEIELNFGVTGNGGIALIGKLEVGVEAAIKVKIKREIVK